MAVSDFDLDSAFDGLTEDELVEDAEVDSLIREAIVPAIGDAAFNQSKVNQVNHSTTSQTLFMQICTCTCPLIHDRTLWNSARCFNPAEFVACVVGGCPVR